MKPFYLCVFTLCFACLLLLPEVAKSQCDASFFYTDSVYCETDAPVLPVVTGDGGGIFSSVPSGLSLNVLTGEITPVNSQIGSYVVTYTVTDTGCTASESFPIEIVGLSNPAMVYGDPTLCTTDGPVGPILGVPGGIFSATPSGLVLNASSGTIDPGGSVPGSYWVRYDVTFGGCALADSVLVTVVQADTSVGINYMPDTICGRGELTPIVTGAAGGIFLGVSGLLYVDANGTIDLYNSAPGTYTIRYVTDTACVSAAATDVLTILALDSAAFQYTQDTFCRMDSLVRPVFEPYAPGHFFPVVLGMGMVDSLGGIDLDEGFPGTYEVIYQTYGPCPTVSRDTVTIILCSPNGTVEPGLGGLLQVAPVPNGGRFSLLYGGRPVWAELDVLSPLGQVVLKRRVHLGGEVLLELPDTGTGIYVVRVRTASEEALFRVPVLR